MQKLYRVEFKTKEGDNRVVGISFQVRANDANKARSLVVPLQTGYMDFVEINEINL